MKPNIALTFFIPQSGIRRNDTTLLHLSLFSNPPSFHNLILHFTRRSAAAQQDLFSLYKKVQRQETNNAGAVDWNRPFDDSSDSGRSEDA